MAAVVKAEGAVPVPSPPRPVRVESAFHLVTDSEADSDGEAKSLLKLI